VPIRPARVLVTGAGGPSAVSILKSLGPVPGVSLWAADIDPNAAGLYLVPADRRLLLPRGDAPGFAEQLLEWCRYLSIDVVFPTVDQELLPLATSRGRFESVGSSLVLAGAAVLHDCLDKWRLYQVCRGQVPVPRTALLDAGLSPQEWLFPVITKPRSGSGSRDVRLVHDEAGLEGLPHDGSFLVQEYLPGDEHSLDVLADLDGGVRAVVPRSRLKVDSGVAVAGRTLHDPELESLGRSVAVAVGLTWVGNIQTRRDGQGRARLLEVNPRFPGTMPLTVAAGVDMPAIALAMAQGWSPPMRLPFRDVAMVRYLEERFVSPAELQAVPRRAPAALEPTG
jgi:carbamoyl-phosphate synthase large subunit